MSISTEGIASPNPRAADESATVAGALAPAFLSAARIPSGDVSGDVSGGSAGMSASAGLNGLLAPALAASLKKLRESLDAVRWPENGVCSGVSSGASFGARGISSGNPHGATDDTASGNPSNGVAAQAARSVAFSVGFDPDAPATLAPGAYTLDYMAGAAGSTGADAARVVIRVYSGDTWRDVLQRLSRALGAAGPGELSRLVPVAAASAIGAPRRKTATPSEAQARELAGALIGVLDAAAAVGAALAHSGPKSGAHAGKSPSPGSRLGGIDWPGLPASLARGLARAGVRHSGGDGGALWLSGGEFLAAFYADPVATRATLAGPDGLLPLLARRANEFEAAARDFAGSAPGGKNSAMAGALPGTADAGTSGPVLTEAEAERGGRRILDTSDAGAIKLLDGSALGESGSLLRRRG